MRIMYVTLVAALGLLLAPAPAAAQFCIGTDEQEDPDANSVAACAAATITPFGALPTLLPANVLGRATTGIGFNFRFANMDEEGDFGRRNFGIGIDIPMGKASLGITGGYADFTCDAQGEALECQNVIMVGGHFVTPLVTNPIGAGDSGQSFVLGLNASLGFGTGDLFDANFGGESVQISARGFSVGVGTPIALVARTGSIRITPFIEPAFFWGDTNLEVSTSSFGSEDQSESGTGFALGGGVSFGFASGFAFDIGFKKVMLDEAKALIGLGLSYQR
jgi:opacity protein-like surface antigen